MSYSLVCLDTDILIALLRGDEDAKRAIAALEEKGETISTSMITAYELLKGAATSMRERIHSDVTGLLSQLGVLTLTLEACSEAAQILQALRKDGKTIGEFDVLIAAIAISNREDLLTRDGHFGRIDRLHVREW
ncbi:MAG: type II toxin-antitoxin system VapC family toxin [Thaumarchaeota archaeon]|nr:type II toxin-antitoxin system VapC family toxin [Nitrososphaerota archaeon]